jgi:hypothetical protein
MFHLPKCSEANLVNFLKQLPPKITPGEFFIEDIMVNLLNNKRDVVRYGSSENASSILRCFLY